MEEMPKKREYNSLSDQELGLFNEDLEIILTTDHIIELSEEEARDKRKDAVIHLADGLNDVSINKDVANMMMDYHLNQDIRPTQVLYAYMNVIQQANEAETFRVPNRLLGFVAEIAQKEGEDSIAGDISQLRSPFEELIGEKMTSSIVEYTDEDIFEDELAVIEGSTARVAKGFRDNLDIIADEEDESLGGIINETFDNLNESLSPDHAADALILENHTYEADDLFKDLATGRFKTAEGRNAAAAAQDLERLKQYGEDEDELFRQLQLGRFLTAEGFNAAILRQDLERLQSHSAKADELLKDLCLHRYISDEGMKAAEYAQDAQRIAEHGGDADSLKKDLKLNNFLTKQGKQEALHRIKELEL